MSAGWWVYSSGLYPEGGFLRTRILFIYMISINSEYLCLIRPFSYKICIQEIMLKEINSFLLTCKPLRTNIYGPFISVLYSKLSKIFFLRIFIAYLAGVGKNRGFNALCSVHTILSDNDLVSVFMHPSFILILGRARVFRIPAWICSVCN